MMIDTLGQARARQRKLARVFRVVRGGWLWPLVASVGGLALDCLWLDFSQPGAWKVPVGAAVIFLGIWAAAIAVTAGVVAAHAAYVTWRVQR